MTMRHVLDALQYSNEDLLLTHTDMNIENWLDTPIAEVPVGQMDIFPAGQAPALPDDQPSGQRQPNGQRPHQPPRGEELLDEANDPPEDQPNPADIQLIASLFGLGHVYR
jgi:hypothetical protein